MNSSIHHVDLTVHDLGSTLEFYRDVLNLPVVFRFEIDDEEFTTAVSVDGAPARFAHLDGGDVRVEPIEYDLVGTDTDEPTLNRPGMTHLGFSVEDVNAAVAQLPADTKMLSEPQTTETSIRTVFIRNPERNPVRLLGA